MSVGIYGTKKLSNVDYNDVDILYAFSESREVLGGLQMQPLFGNITNNDFKKLLGADGAYKLRLPASTFNQLGFYIVLVKPKSYETSIVDCSFIVSVTNDDIQVSKKGIVIPKLQFQGTGSLVGYQIEYFDQNGVKIKNFSRIITSSDLVAPSATSSGANSKNYVLNPNGTYLFLTLTPDEASLISNAQPADLGSKGQQIVLSNTYFDPVMIEVEMVDQTVKTLSYGIFGNSTRDLEYGIYSIFDEAGNLYKQYNLLTRKKQFANGEVDIKQERTQINFNQNFLQLSQQA